MKCSICRKDVLFGEWFINNYKHKKCLQKEKKEDKKVKTKEIKPKEEIIDLDKEVRNIGIVLIVLGILHMIFSGFLDFTWGLVLISTGIISLFYRSRKMLLTFGVLLILVGILNIFSFDETGEISFFWLIFGTFQIIWGIQEINRFKKTKENPRYLIKEKRKKGFI